MTSALFALRALNEVPGALAKGRATFVGVPDEESGATGTLGIKWLDANGLLHGMGAIYAYSGNRIHLGHRGLVRYRIVCHGKANHTGNPGWQNRTDGVNAVTAMARLILALEAVETPYSSQPYFDRFRTVITPGTVISGGTAINIVPDRCEALIDVRTTPEFDFDDVQVTLHECIDGVVDAVPGARFEMSVTAQLPAALSDPDAPIFTVLASATEDLTGHTPERVVAGPANEGYLLIERGIPTVCGFGPAGDNFHAVDEYVEIDGLVEAAQIFAVTARRLAMTIDR